MDRLKALRTAHNYTQKQIAQMLRTTQQTIARWETGKAEPNVSALRDLAMIFGTSVDDLLGKNPFSKKLISNHLEIFGRDRVIDGFWGHVGLLMYGEKHTKWFPITLCTASQISSFLASVDEDGAWTAIPTLNNKMLLVNTVAVRRIWLLDDACDAPEDWSDDAMDDYSGMPIEFYRGLHAFFCYESDLQDNASEAFRGSIDDYVKDKGLDEETAMRMLHETTIYMDDGTCTSYWAEPNQMYDLVFQADLGALPKIIRIDAYGEDFESYFPQKKLAVIVMPLIDVLDAAKKVNAEFGIDDENQQNKPGRGNDNQ